MGFCSRTPSLVALGHGLDHFLPDTCGPYDVHIITDTDDVIMKRIMLAVSRTVVSPWAIWLLPSSRS